jgi:hypothetical protein
LTGGLSGGDEIAFNTAYPLVESTTMESKNQTNEEKEHYMNLFNLLKQFISPKGRGISDFINKKTRFNLGNRSAMHPSQQFRLAHDEGFANISGFEEEPKMIEDHGNNSPMQPLLQKADSYGFLDANLSKRKISVGSLHAGAVRF